jgi:ubiquinol-cytochrome c reductase cytochrome c subunit
VKHAHERDGTRSGRSAAGLIAALVVAGAAFVAIALAPTAPAAGAEASGVPGGGARLYLENCASCHGAQGEGAATGPTLVGVGAASVDFYLRTGRMPLGAPDQRPHRQPPRFDDAEIRALVDHVVGFGGDGPAIPEVTDGGDVGRGWELYTANCAACHAATGAGNAVGGGFVAYGLGQATDVQIAEAMLIGPGAMPRFSFSDEERDAIVAYVRYLRNAPSPGGAPIGGFGPVAEGFVAVVIGLTALVVVALFVGRQSHPGEPRSPLPTEPLLETAADEGADGGARA